MTTTLFTAILASGLALALSREHRIRRAFQTLAARPLDNYCTRESPPQAGVVDCSEAGNEV